MSSIGHGLCILALAAGGLLARPADAAVTAIDLNDFFTFDPEVTISADGRSAEFMESELVSFVRLANDPFVGDPNVIVPMAGSSLTFAFELVEAPGGDDAFSAVLFDSQLGVYSGELERFEVMSSQSGLASFDLTPHVGLTLGLEFELAELDPLGGTLGSVASVSNLSIVAPAVPVPGALVLLGSALVPLALRRRRR
jgi:hypothetical protein